MPSCMRDNAESIAFYRGKSRKSSGLAAVSLQVLRNYNLLIGWQRNLSFLTTAYRYMPVVLPYLVLFPQYFSGKIHRGYDSGQFCLRAGVWSIIPHCVSD